MQTFGSGNRALRFLVLQRMKRSGLPSARRRWSYPWMRSIAAYKGNMSEKEEMWREEEEEEEEEEEKKSKYIVRCHS